MLSTRSLALLLAALALLIAPAIWLQLAPHDDSLHVARAYLRAVHARDFDRAYRHVSTHDRNVRDRASYLRGQTGFHGVALQLSRAVAAYGSIDLRARRDDTELTVAYRLPSLEDLSPLARHWDNEKLNALTSAERREILRQVEARWRSGKLVMIEGQETIRLVKEPADWKVFLNWQQSLKVKLRAASSSADIEARFAQSELFVTGDEPFQVNLTLRNTGATAQQVTLLHQIEPQELSDELAMIECGLSRPVTLAAGSEREFAMAYLLAANSRDSRREVALIYVLQTHHVR